MVTLTPRLLSRDCSTSFGLKCFIYLNSFNNMKLELCSTELKNVLLSCYETVFIRNWAELTKLIPPGTLSSVAM